MPKRKDPDAVDAKRLATLYRAAIAMARATRLGGAPHRYDASVPVFPRSPAPDRAVEDTPVRPAPRAVANLLPRLRRGLIAASLWLSLRRSHLGALAISLPPRRLTGNLLSTGVVIIAVMAAALLIFDDWDAPGAPRSAEAPDTAGAPHGGGLDAGVFADCATCPPLRTITVPPGRAEHPKAPFAMGVYEVTVGQWRACVAAGRCSAIPLDLSTRNNDQAPVVGMLVGEAEEYLRYLNDTTCLSYRLPSDAEWEYAARAQAPPKASVSWQHGDAAPPRGEYCLHANLADRGFDGQVSFYTDRADLYAAFLARAPRARFTMTDCAEPSARCPELGATGRYLITERVLPADPAQRGTLPCLDGHEAAATVGGFPANGFGLHDVIGNVWEITRVRRGDTACGLYAMRGGSHINTGQSVDLLAYRACNIGLTTDWKRRPYIGFRVVREPASEGVAQACPPSRAASGQHHLTENVN